jgi:hypothetical protein
MFKLAVTPLVLGMDWRLATAREENKLLALALKSISVLVVLVGAVVATVADVSISTEGLCGARSAQLRPRGAHLLQQRRVRDWGITPARAEYILSAPKTVTGVFAFLMFERCSMSPTAVLPWVLLGATGVVAVAMNVVNSWVIGRLSALTFQVTGQVKTVMILALWYVLETALVAPLQMVGAAVAVAGGCMYAWPMPILWHMASASVAVVVLTWGCAR